MSWKHTTKIVLHCFIILFWMIWWLDLTVVQSADMEFQSEQDCIKGIRTWCVQKAQVHSAMVQNAKHYKWNVMYKNIETCSDNYRDCMTKHHTQNRDVMLKLQKWSYILCSKNSYKKSCRIQNFTTMHRTQDNSWTTDNFRPIVLYVWSWQL